MTDPIERAKRRGYAAGLTGVRAFRNPYQRLHQPQQWVAWNEGWSEGVAELEAVAR